MVITVRQLQHGFGQRLATDWNGCASVMVENLSCIIFKSWSPRTMELTLSSETSAFKLQTPGKFPKEHRLHSKHGESLKTTIYLNCFLPTRSQAGQPTRVVVVFPARSFCLPEWYWGTFNPLVGWGRDASSDCMAWSWPLPLSIKIRNPVCCW
jgi:hypothetical protein